MARTIKRAYARYRESFKPEAVRLASQPGISPNAKLWMLALSFRTLWDKKSPNP